MKRKNVIFIIAVFILVAGGFFWWQNSKEIKGSPDDYIIKETEEGIFVENKKAGLIVKAPEAWEVKKIEEKEGSVLVYTLNMEGKESGGIVLPPLIAGCGIEVSVVYKEMNFKEIEEKIKAIHWGLRISSENFEEIMINNYPALKNTFDSEILGSVMSIYIPIENKLYDFDLYFSSDEKEKCIQEFESFLRTISINPD